MNNLTHTHTHQHKQIEEIILVFTKNIEMLFVNEVETCELLIEIQINFSQVQNNMRSRMLQTNEK